MSVILAIDPGPTRSAWVRLMAGVPLDWATSSNDDLLPVLRELGSMTVVPDVLVIEKVESFGMAVGAEIFETVYWSGRFHEAARRVPVERIGRRAVKLAICGDTRAKDTNIRAALIDRFGGSSAIGRKASPGPLYGIAGDVWSALAVAVTWADQQ